MVAWLVVLNALRILSASGAGLALAFDLEDGGVELLGDVIEEVLEVFLGPECLLARRPESSFCVI